MTENLRDVLTFVSPDGGKITMTMDNYPAKEIERLKKRLSENGWEFVEHDVSVIDTSWIGKFSPYFAAAVVGMIVQWIIQAWLGSNV